MSLSTAKTKGRPIARILYTASGELNKRRKKFLYLDEKGDENSSWEIDESVGMKGLSVLPNENICEKLYVTGPSNSGKSTYTGNYLGEFFKIKKFKKYNYIVFSNVKEDKVLDMINGRIEPVRPDIDYTLLEDFPESEEFEKSITVFDDCGTITNRQLNKAVCAIQDDLLECGRHVDAHMIVTSHLMSNYITTRKVLNEATSITFFPKSGATIQIRKFLASHIGLDKDQIKKIMKLPSRWVTVYRTYPMYVIHNKGCFMLSSMDD